MPFLFPRFTSSGHKGFALPALAWTGDEDAVERATALSHRLTRAHRRRMAADYLEAVDAMQDFCTEMGLTASDAERVIFVARLTGDLADDELETLKRTGHGNARIGLDEEFGRLRGRGEGARRLFR